MVWLALDIGERRIGVAVSDPQEIIAQPLCTLTVERRGKFPLAELKGLLGERQAEGVVVGLPRRLDGGEGPQAAAARELARRLEGELEVPVVLWDERLSSVEAERRLLEAGIRRRRRREVTDRVAAALVLEGFLGWRREQDRRGQDGKQGVEP